MKRLHKKAQTYLNSIARERKDIEKALKKEKTTRLIIMNLGAAAIIGVTLALIFLTSLSVTGRAIETNTEGNIYGFIIISGIALLLTILLLRWFHQNL